MAIHRLTSGIRTAENSHFYFNYFISLRQVVIAVPHSSEHQLSEQQSSEHQSSEFQLELQNRDSNSNTVEIDPRDVPKVFRCGFKVVDAHLRDKLDLFDIWNEYKPFLEFLTNKVEGCTRRYGDSQAERWDFGFLPANCGLKWIGWPFFFSYLAVTSAEDYCLAP